MKTLILLCLFFSSLYSSGQLWHLSGQAALFPFNSSNGLAAEKIYVSVSDNNGTPVKGLRAANFIAYGETCPDPNNGNACNFVDLESLPLLTIEEKPGLYSMIFRTKDKPGTPIKTVFIKVFTTGVPPGPNKLPPLIQHGQIVLTPIR